MIYNGEELFECVHHPHYYVTETGRIYSSYKIGGRGMYGLSYLHEMKYGHDKDGYLRVVLCNNNQKRYVKVHTLIVEQFIGDVIPPMVVNHINGCKSNNSRHNLEIVSVKENTVHAHSSGLIHTDTPVDVAIGDTINHFQSIAECIRRFPDLSREYVKQIQRHEITYSVVEFRKRESSRRITPIDCYYNGCLWKTFPRMIDCDAYCHMARGATSSAIQIGEYRRKVNQYHITFPNVSTIESAD